MKIDKAIEILPEFYEICAWPRTQDQIAALKLGIEALKKIKECQAHNCTLSHIELPGETEN